MADVLPGADVSDDRIARLLGERSLGWTLPLFFLFGLALAFTPCMLPMLPIVSGLVVGSRPAPARALALTLAFVLPMAATYALLGVAAALAGASVQALLQNRWTLLGLGAVYVVLAAGMFGVFTLQLPGWLRDRLDAASRRTRGGSLAGAGAMGVLSALLVGPCMTAPLAGVLLHIAQGGRPLEGALLLFSLGLGSGLPLVLAGTLGARLLPRPGMWMERVKALLGFVLLGTAVWTVQRAVAAPLALLAWGVLLLAAALALAHLAAPSAAARDESAAGLHPPLRLAARTLALAAGLWGSAMVLGAAAGRGDPWQPLAFGGGPPTAGAVASAGAGRRFEPLAGVAGLEARLAVARERGQPLLVDFYADWCVSCQAIEHEVLGDARVQRALDGMVLLRADVTANDADSRDLMRAYGVIGPPTVMIFDPAGHERRDARLVGEFTAEQLLKRLAAAAAPQP